MLHIVLSKVRRLASGLLVAGLAAYAGSASAVVFVGNWDPLFNATFDSDFGWRGTTTVTVSASCLANAGSVVTMGSTPGCPVGDAVLNLATLQFYDADLPLPPPGVDLATSSPFNLTKVAISPGGTVSGIELVGALFSAPYTNPLFTGTWVVNLNFFLDGPQLVLDESCASCDPRQFTSDVIVNGVPTRPQMTWAVPEPATIALFGAALAGLGMSRRRRA